MTDKATLLERLEDAAERVREAGFRGHGTVCKAIAVAVEALKAQEPVEPYVTGRGTGFESDTSWWYACGNCHKPIDPKDQFCSHCGRAVKWDG